MEKPIKRSAWRLAFGVAFYRCKRTIQWYAAPGKKYAVRRVPNALPYSAHSHRTPLFRQLSEDDRRLQANKAVNLRLASEQLNGLLIRPGETFSYWKTIGKPTRGKGYLEGMVLQSGKVGSGIGGGLCQMSNLIYWMTLHTPLTVTERHRHSYDVFPDAGRTQPFGSGATCFYNFLDLQIRNDTESAFQLLVRVTDTELQGEWRTDAKPSHLYRCYEKKHWFSQALWGGYVRHNVIYRIVNTPDGEELADEYVTENHALMMYEPLLPPGQYGSDRNDT